MMSKLIWLSFFIASLYSTRSLVKCEEIDLNSSRENLIKRNALKDSKHVFKPYFHNDLKIGELADELEDTPYINVNSENQDEKSKTESPTTPKEGNDGAPKDENDFPIAFLDDIRVWRIQKKEIRNITCKGDPCNKIDFKEPFEGNTAYTFSLVNPLADSLTANYNLVCRNIEDNDKRKCIIEMEVSEKKEEKEEGTEEKKNSGDDKSSTKHLPFIFGFLGAELLIVLVLGIVFGLNGKGPLKKFLRPDRS